MQHSELKFVAELPPGYDARTTLVLGPGNTIVAFDGDKPLLYLDESTMQWCVLDKHISEVTRARKAD
jgi:hypothetical protein